MLHGHAKEEVVCVANGANGEKSINTEQSASTVLNHGDYSLLTNDSYNSMGNNDNTYAKVTARRPPTKSIQHGDIRKKCVIIEKSIYHDQ